MHVCELNNAGKMMRLLGYARLWRVVRLVITTLNLAQNDHDKVMSKLRIERIQSNKLKNDLSVINDGLREEKKARTMVERMLKGCEDEVDALKEALEIAAFHVTAVSPRGEKTIVEDIAVRVSDKTNAFDIDAKDKGGNDLFVIHKDGSFESPRSVTC